jgi:hypothetical protein
VLKADGQTLEETATIRIDRKEYRPVVDPASRRAQEGGKFYTHLEWTIPWKPEFDAPTHLLEVENDDGQVASKDLTLKTFRIAKAHDVAATKSEVVLAVDVTDAIGTFEGEWSPPGEATAKPIPGSKIETSGGKVRVKLTPGEAEGIGRISLIDSSNQRAVAPVNVIAVTATPTTAAAGQQVTVTLAGKGLPALSKAEWKPEKGSSTPLAVVQSAGGPQVTFDTGEKGTGILEVRGDDDFVAQVKITVT